MRKPKLQVKLASYLFLTVMSVVAVYPVLRVLAVSLRPGNRLFSTSLRLIPAGASLQSYISVLRNRDLLLWVTNSIMITVPTALIGVMLTASAAYALARMRVPWRRQMLIGLLAVQLVPGAAAAMATYLMIIRLGLVNTYLGLVIAYTIGAAPFSIWILRGSFANIDPALEEAALVDGATMLQSLVHIVLPIAAPILGVVFVLSFLGIWSEFMLARLILARPHLLTWPVGLMQLQGQYLVAWGEFAAGGILVGVPSMIVFALASRHLSSGLLMGSVD
ncbi:sugar ABC transporter permease [Spirochaeta africana]|uniref:Maltose/maltodextrin transport system permease protein MalG n=1 Tax=Spirochaeta africana (strain ATCC 700263 / DSM 8902 / Z-7692) TaxID=889378 RepID=H9UM57_SPIAZ|nr:ABC transporter permease subunit [Spirochaeta africana]AFG38600.1 ABC-type maltose transport systems, permease component [Spirochaeta africana DSM 8902]